MIRTHDLRPLRLAVLGCGRMGRHHVQAARRLPGVEVVALMDASEANLRNACETLEVSAGYRDLDSLIDAHEIDVAHIVTPPGHHEALARRCVERGIHIYVEKPFANRASDAAEILREAGEHGVEVGAGHQLLLERPTRRAAELLPGIGRLVHAESYFSFKPSRPPDGSPPLTRVEQLLDILPHPTYLLEHFLSGPEGEFEVLHLRSDSSGEVRATCASGSATGSLVATLSGRPVDAYVRLVGTRGTLTVDYVRGIVQRALEGGTIAKIVTPYQAAWTSVWGTTTSLGARLLKRQRFYPGLVESFAAFYRAVRGEAPPPVSRTNILRTVELCERVRTAITAAAGQPPETEGPAPTIAVTGGTGFLGKPTVRALTERGVTPLVLSRRLPPEAERIPGAVYRAIDLGSGRPLELPGSVECVIHCAAETTGGWAAHERNSLAATRALLEGMQRSGASRLVYVSSIAVVDQNTPEPIPDGAPRDPDPRRRGPYVWGKLEAERLAEEAGPGHGIDVKIVRPSALVDFADFEPPGKLGKAVGGLYVAVGPKRRPLAVVDVGLSGRVLAEIALDFHAAPATLNLTDPEAPTRRELVERLRTATPGIRVVWLPWWFLHLTNPVLWLVQKVLRRGAPPISLTSVFRSPRYASDAMQDLVRRALPPVAES